MAMQKMEKRKDTYQAMLMCWEEWKEFYLLVSVDDLAGAFIVHGRVTLRGGGGSSHLTRAVVFYL